MRTVHIAWRPEEATFDARGTHVEHGITINAPRPPDEPGPPTGFSPTELLLAGIGSCSAWDVVQITRKARMAVTAVEVTVSGEQAPDPPWRYERIGIHFALSGQRLERTRVERAIRLACDRYCSVIATIRGVATTEWTLELIDDEAGGPRSDGSGRPAG
jgi:putative redox protein